MESGQESANLHAQYALAHHQAVPLVHLKSLIGMHPPGRGQGRC